MSFCEQFDHSGFIYLFFMKAHICSDKIILIRHSDILTLEVEYFIHSIFLLGFQRGSHVEKNGRAGLQPLYHIILVIFKSIGLLHNKTLYLIIRSIVSHHC